MGAGGAAKPGLLLLGKPALAAVGTAVAVATATVVYAVVSGGGAAERVATAAGRR